MGINFEDRTLIYTGGVKPDVMAAVTAGVEAASTRAGQTAILTAVNILARSHPGVVVAVPDEPLLVRVPTGGDSLRQASENLAKAARAEVVVEIADKLPAHCLSLGIGSDSPMASVYVGAARWTALVGDTPLAVAPEASSLLGLGMAVTLATGYLFRVALGWPAVSVRSLSLWTLGETNEPTGPADLVPVDVGTAWLVGAGAVGSCLGWWLSFIGVVGEWIVIDGDLVDSTNLNRSLGLFDADAGSESVEAVAKAEALARLIPGSIAYSDWFDEWVKSDPPSPDVVIPVANERGIRTSAACYGHPAVIHAATSRQWSAELHRHLSGVDGCIICRLPEDEPRFACATAPAEPTPSGPRKDAALAFLSAAAGLLLASGLLQLQAGEWANHDRNHWRIFFDDSVGAIHSSRWRCRSGCSSLSPADVRRHLHGTTRWWGLDSGTGTMP